jgi:hypothetical protein
MRPLLESMVPASDETTFWLAVLAPSYVVGRRWAGDRTNCPGGAVSIVEGADTVAVWKV